MKLEIKENGSKNYYNEVWYIASKYNKLKKNPKSKVYNLTKYRLIQLLAGLLIGLIYLYLAIHDSFFYIVVGFALFYIVLLTIIIIINNKRLNNFLKNNITKTIEIDSVGIHYYDDVKSFITKWDDIIYIIINKESISFLPKTNYNYIITIGIKYKEEVIKAIKKYKKESLIVDNL